MEGGLSVVGYGLAGQLALGGEDFQRLTVGHAFGGDRIAIGADGDGSLVFHGSNAGRGRGGEVDAFHVGDFVCGNDCAITTDQLDVTTRYLEFLHFREDHFMILSIEIEHAELAFICQGCEARAEKQQRCQEVTFHHDFSFLCFTF